MDYTKLDDLMKITKKGDASQTNKNLFTEEMCRMLKEEGLTEQSIEYMRNGFGFSSAKPLAIYIRQSSEDHRREIIDRVMQSDLVKSGDKVAAFKMAVSLSAYSIQWLGKDQRLLAEMIKILPGLSRNKEKKMLKDASKIYEKYYFSVLEEKTEYPTLNSDELGLKDHHLCEYRKMLETILKDVSKKYNAKIAPIYAWLGIGNALDGKEDSSAKDRETVESKDDVKQPIVPYSHADLESILTGVCEFSDRMRATVDQWVLLEKSSVLAQERISQMMKTIEDLNRKNELLTKSNESLNEELIRNKEYGQNLKEQIEKLETTVSDKDTQIKELQEEIAKMNSILSVYTADKQNAQSEQLNAIASKLKSEYRDFQDVANEQMTVDLGENFRFQLQSIFRILMKAGIDVERR